MTDFKKGDYVRYKAAFLRDVAGVGQVKRVDTVSGTASIQWSNKDMGKNGVVIEQCKYLELVPKEDVPLAILAML